MVLPCNAPEAVRDYQGGDLMKKIGIYNPYIETRGGGEKVCLALAGVLSQDHKVELVTHDYVDLEELSEYFGIDLTKVRVRVIKLDSLGIKIINRIPFLPGGVRNLMSDMKLSGRIKTLKYDMFINNCYQSNLPGPSKFNVYMCMFPQRVDLDNARNGFVRSLYKGTVSLLRRIVLHPSKNHAVYTYDLITANSRYTQSYIKKYWGLESEILYPICDDMYDKKLNNKQKQILSVGRFFEKTKENHHKRQDFLVNTFIKMDHLHKNGWELHLAGSVAENAGSLKYILSLMKKAKGYPVFFHFNCGYTELKKLYNESTIYWHATGYGSSPKKYPEKQEHFGITTVEAMSAGAIPIVINSAGQKESVKSNENGYLWTDEREIAKLTNQVIDLKPNDRETLSVAAKSSAKGYGYRAFELSVKRIFNDLEQ